jgi:tetratricopeptide (TPR) repeat protein
MVILVDDITQEMTQETVTGDILAQRGIEAYQRGEYSKAVQLLEQSLQVGISQFKPVLICTILGNNYSDMGNLERAVASYQRALELDTRFYKAWVGLGIANRKLGNFAETERCYQTALEIAPNYAELHASLGALYIFQGKSPEAIRALEKAIALDPSVAVAHGNIALAYAMANRFAEAEAALKQAVVLGYKEHKNIRERIQALKASPA